MDISSFKTNFVGKDGFIWWIGQIPDQKSWQSQVDGAKGSWAIRYKVRIMGYHPIELSDEDLPWAQVLCPPGTQGSGGHVESIKLHQGDTVIGFFLDGSSAQIPVIMGVFANTLEKEKGRSDQPSPFGNFTPKSDTVVGDADYVLKQEGSDSTGEGNGEKTQVFPQNVNKQQADSVGNAQLTSSAGVEINNCNGTTPITGMKSGVKNLINDVKGINARLGEGTEFARDAIKNRISSASSDITGKAGGLVSGMVSDTFTKIAPIANGGMQTLYTTVNAKVTAATGLPPVGHLAGVAAQTAMAAPLQTAENLIGCLANNIIGDLGGNIEDILNSVVDNTANFVDCVGDQTVGAITNTVIDKVGDGMDKALGGLDKILQFSNTIPFNKGQVGKPGKDFVQNLIRNSTSAIAGSVGLAGCNEPPKTEVGSCRYVLGYGPTSAGDADLGSIMKNANLASALSDAARLTGFPLDGIQDIAGGLDIFNSDMKTPGFKSAISDCYSGLPEVCEPPKVKIFGGNGSGGEAVPIFGKILGDSRYRTGSIIDLKLTNPGNNYTFPPFVEIVDNCDQGFGAVARTTIKDGKIDKIYIVTEGENYPVGEQREQVIESVNVLFPGSGYEDGDEVVDNFGNEYNVKIDRGFIVEVTPLTQIVVDDIPELRTKGAGSGAILTANINDRPEFQGEVKQVIDCIAPRTGNLVGYVKGEPYYGDFHVHPNTGKKMVGAAHTTTPHEIIYDTPEESL